MLYDVYLVAILELLKHILFSNVIKYIFTANCQGLIFNFVHEISTSFPFPVVSHKDLLMHTKSLIHEDG